MPVMFVPNKISDPKASPSNILSKPAAEIIILLNLSDFDVTANGVDIMTVNIAIDIIVPIEKNTRKSTPDLKSGVVGNMASITAALPANPCTSPIM